MLRFAEIGNELYYHFVYLHLLTLNPDFDPVFRANLARTLDSIDYRNN